MTKIFFKEKQNLLPGIFIKFANTPRSIIFYDVTNRIKRRKSINIKECVNTIVSKKNKLGIFNFSKKKESNYYAGRYRRN